MASKTLTKVNEKICIMCKQTKPISSAFYKNGVKKDGSPRYNSWCKECRLKTAKVTYHEGNKYYSSILDKRSKTPRHYLSYILSKAKKRKDCTLTLDELDEMYHTQNGLCALTGRVMTYRSGEKNVMSIDRIDSTKTYTKDNVQLVCKEANILKWNLTKEELISLCKEVIAYNG
jgi:hypothetical protein